MNFKLIRTTTCLYYEIIYLDETIEFYRKQGFDLQYFYLNYLKPELKDDSVYEEIKEKYKDQKDVIIKHFPHRKRLSVLDLYENHYDEYKNDWITNCDLDEFFYSPLENKTIRDIIQMYEEKNISAISVNWRVFGNNFLKENPGFKVLKVYTKCSELEYRGNNNIRSFFKFKNIDFKKINDIEHTGHKFPLKNNLKYINTRFDINNSEIKMNIPLLICNHYQYKSDYETELKHKNNLIKPELGLTIRYSYKQMKSKEIHCNKIDNFEILKKL